MGKKSLIKSTTKKKKESGKTTAKASKKSPAAKAAPPDAAEPVMAEPLAVAPEIPADPRGLLFRRFPSPEWPQVTIPAPSTAHVAPPPFVGVDDPAEADRIRGMLLNRRHTMAEIQAVAEPPAPVVEAPAPSEPVDPREVLFRRFPSPEWPQVTIPAPSTAHAAPPPFVGVDDPAEADRIRGMLLNRRHTMAEIQAVAEPPAPVEIPVQEKPAATGLPTESPPLTDHTETAAATEPGPEPAQAAIAPTAPVPESAPPPIAHEPADPVLRYARYAALGFALLIIVLIGASYVNSTTCYLHVNNGDTELWEGRFSPMGKTLVTTLKDFTPPDPTRSQYKRNEIYPAVFNHYLNLADDMAASAATPDFRTIHLFLTKARDFAVDETSRNAVGMRLNSLALMTLLYKADVAASVGGEESLATAAQLLTEAQKIATDQTQMEMIKRKQDNVNALAAELKTRPAAPNSEAEAATPEAGLAPQAK